MKIFNLFIPYYASMTSVLKFFVLYLLSKWYGISFAFPFMFLCTKIYQRFIYKRYNFLPLTINDYFLIIKSIFQKNYIKEIKIDVINKEKIIKLIKQFINENNTLNRILVYKYCNYYWKILKGEDLFNKVIINKEINNLEKKLSKKFELLKGPNYKIFIDEAKQKIFIKYNSIFFQYINLIELYIDEMYDKKYIKNKKTNKFVKIILEFISFPIYLFLEIIVIFLLSITYL